MPLSSLRAAMLGGAAALISLFLPGMAAAADAAPSALDPKVVRLALTSLKCAQASGQPAARRLGVIDYTRPSTARRFWVLDLETGKPLFEEHVAHGRGSGDANAVRFSNVPESYTSSLGLFRTLGAYEGQNGYSLRLEGLERGVNDLALARAIVIHGADYVSEGFMKIAGRLGRSFGCPAVRREIARPLIDSLKNGQYVFAYAADATWMKTSAYLSCPTQAADSVAVRFTSPPESSSRAPL